MRVVMFIAVLLTQARLLTGCTGGGGVIFSTLIEKKVSFIFLCLIFGSYIR